MSLAEPIPSSRTFRGVPSWTTFLAALLALVPLARAAEEKAEDPPYPHGDFTEDCALCHAPDRWVPAAVSKEFDHRKLSGFPLTGGHQTAACRNCHPTLEFKLASPSCVGCHRDIHLGELGVDCGRCHTTRAFRDRTGMGRAHERTRFSLTGRHVAADCESCHTPSQQGQLQWVNTPVDCYSCHKPDYDATTAPSHAALGFPTDCAQCHTTGLWAPASFDHAQSSFALTGAHATVNCSSCHASGRFDGLPTECVSCHRPDFDATTDPPHKAGGFPQTCTQCHSTVSWAGASFTHPPTFPLSAGHAGVSCQSCHGDGVYKGKSTDCYACHRPDYERTTAPAHPAAGFSTTCTQCHTTASWAGASYAHTPRFPLTGGHAGASCQSCHGDGVYAGKSTRCESCHQPEYDRTTDPSHRQAAFPNDCTLCHTIVGWRPSTFDHGRSQFPLTGAHVGLSCSQCHSDGVYDGKPTDCASCHRDDYDRTTDPAHGAAGFSTTCTQCHTTATWAGASYAHTPRFPLTGGHAAASCQSCHGDGVYAGKSTRCESCHQPDYDRTTDPSHRQAAFPNDCTLCHTIVGWRPSSFDHGRSQFPLTGAHVGLSCSQCHSDGVYDGKPTDCASCHRADYDRTTDPAHGAAGFSTTCTQCHTTATWAGASYAHTPSFPLTGGHAGASCQACHGDGVYAGKSTRCESCHQPDYDRTTDPNHRQAAFPNDCTLCHTIVGWRPSSFDHGTTQFPLQGAHAGLSCSQCHFDGVYDGKPTDCYSCHRKDYDGATDPNHRLAGFPTDCTLCHTGTTSWSGATYNHQTTGFPLTGAHTTLACAACHADGVYDGKSTACASCHQPDYDRTTDPNHRAAGFAATCQDCHTTVTWDGARFDHSGTSFPLTGAHVPLGCNSCHSDNVYDGKSTACASCHQADYDRTTDPNHRTARFPTDCALCHTTIQWPGARFEHDAQYFPIYSGKHSGKWSRCSDCHTNSNNYAEFSCLGCHPHSDRGKTDGDHRDEPGYRYESRACYQCHPQGRAE
ncbi:MAG: hypothetical protein MUF27_04710 [Acidobacteria bacterium]|nr:hypothetical protein [Acidobacteriota bacterium]